MIKISSVQKFKDKTGKEFIKLEIYMDLEQLQLYSEEESNGQHGYPPSPLQIIQMIEGKKLGFPFRKKKY